VTPVGVRICTVPLLIVASWTRVPEQLILPVLIFEMFKVTLPTTVPTAEPVRVRFVAVAVVLVGPVMLTPVAARALPVNPAIDKTAMATLSISLRMWFLS
jgi:hypothetical protein